MRFYRIIIPGAPPAFQRVPGEPGETIWSTFINGQHNPNAQQIEFNIEETTYNPVPTPGSTMTVMGVSWEQISQTNGLIGCPIQFIGGMSPGLPIANFQSTRAGLIMYGKILKAWGNWIGTDMSIGMSFVAAGLADASESGGGGGGGGDGGGGGGGGGDAGGSSMQQVMSRRYYTRTGPRSIDRMPFSRGRAIGSFGGPSISPAINIGGAASSVASSLGDASVTAGGLTSSLFGGGGGGFSLIKPLNLIHNMMPQMEMKSAIQQTLSTAFPSAGVNVLIKSGLQRGYQDAGMYQNMEQYASYIQKAANSIAGTKNYMGPIFSSFDNTIHVLDGTQSISSGEISILDLIGQPTWIDWNKVSIKCCLRADLHVGSVGTLPQTLYGITSDAVLPTPTAPQRSNSAIAGSFWISKVVHIGDFRNPDGSSWSTNYEALVQSAVSGGVLGFLQHYDPTAAVANQ